MDFRGWAWADTQWVALFQDSGGIVHFCGEGDLETLFKDGVDVVSALFGSLNGLPPWGSQPTQEQIERGARILRQARPFPAHVVATRE